jgi:hypothetical protein
MSKAPGDNRDALRLGIQKKSVFEVGRQPKYSVETVKQIA